MNWTCFFSYEWQHNDLHKQKRCLRFALRQSSALFWNSSCSFDAEIWSWKCRSTGTLISTIWNTCTCMPFHFASKFRFAALVLHKWWQERLEAHVDVYFWNIIQKTLQIRLNQGKIGYWKHLPMITAYRLPLYHSPIRCLHRHLFSPLQSSRDDLRGFSPPPEVWRCVDQNRRGSQVKTECAPSVLARRNTWPKLLGGEKLARRRSDATSSFNEKALKNLSIWRTTS